MQANPVSWRVEQPILRHIKSSCPGSSTNRWINQPPTPRHQPNKKAQPPDWQLGCAGAGEAARNVLGQACRAPDPISWGTTAREKSTKHQCRSLVGTALPLATKVVPIHFQHDEHEALAAREASTEGAVRSRQAHPMAALCPPLALLISCLFTQISRPASMHYKRRPT